MAGARFCDHQDVPRQFVRLFTVLLMALFLPLTATASLTFPSGNLLALNENGTNAITRAYDGLNRVTSYATFHERKESSQTPRGKMLMWKASMPKCAWNC
jgi:hypothetical protein